MSLLVALACVGQHGHADSAAGGLNAKALFFGTDSQVRSVPTAQPVGAESTASAPIKSAAASPKLGERRAARAGLPRALGASYFVRLRHEDGSTRDVLTSHDFSTGSRFQIGLKVNRPLYVYIYNQEPGGKFVQLYPQPGQSNRVDAKGVMYFPNEGSFQFSGEPATEEVSVLMSTKPLARPESTATSMRLDLVSAPASEATVDGCAYNVTAAASQRPPEARTDAATLVAVADTGLTHKAITFEPAVAPCVPRPRLASKAISFVDDPKPVAGESPASYVVKAESRPDDVLHLRLKLSHR